MMEKNTLNNYINIPNLLNNKDYFLEIIADEISRIPKYRITSRKSKMLYLVEYYKKRGEVLVINLPQKPLKTKWYDVTDFSKRINEIIL